MERYLKASAATTSATFYEDGVIVDPGVVTVTITREDGTALVTAQATSGTGAAARTFNLTTTHLAPLDVLTAAWTSATKGTLYTEIQVVGGFLVSTAQMRADPTLANATTYPIADLIAKRTEAEAILEDACGLAFVPRYFRKKVDGNGTTDVFVRPRLLTVDSVIVGATSAYAGTTLTTNELADLELYDDGRLYNSAGWPSGRRNVEVKGSHGYPSLPPYVASGTLALVKSLLIDSPTDDRAASLTGEGGTTQLLKADGTFGIPAADRVVELYGVNHGIG